MHLCGICIADVESPAALPCGHIFCSECISRAVDTIKQYSMLHCCPTCRSRYSVASVDPALTPLNPHYIAPSIRRLYLDQPAPPSSGSTISSMTELVKENRRLRAESSALRTNCEMWRKRAEAHGVATLNLLNLLRAARDQALQVQREQDILNQHHSVLKRRLHEHEPPQLLAKFLPGANNMLAVDERSTPDVPTFLGRPYSSPCVPSSPPGGVVSSLNSDSMRPTKRMKRSEIEDIPEEQIEC